MKYKIESLLDDTIKQVEAETQVEAEQKAHDLGMSFFIIETLCEGDNRWNRVRFGDYE